MAKLMPKLICNTDQTVTQKALGSVYIDSSTTTAGQLTSIQSTLRMLIGVSLLSLDL